MRTILVILGLILLFLTIGYFTTQHYTQKDRDTTTPNPASQNCGDNGGTVTVMKRGNGEEYGLCEFEDNRSCETWALYNGKCPTGGVKTTEYTTIEQKYCAWIGGQTQTAENANCILPDGTTCTTQALYNGNCVPQQVSDTEENNIE